MEFTLVRKKKKAAKDGTFLWQFHERLVGATKDANQKCKG
jgi:hypothetical protein